MKRALAGFLIFFTLACLSAQTNEPVRLALIAESADASTALDVLTAELSGHKNLQLLERSEIEKVYREQGLSAGNKDYLKLGQMLGADGLLLMETAKEGTNQFFNVRLIAVKPGVVLVAERFSWPLASVTGWSAEFARHLDLFLPKLTVLVRAAIPISVVNLRSTVSSADAAEIERQLKLLTIQRLSWEPQFFVLERQQMQLLSGEKDLKLDDSAFWNGSYLLEGAVDQNGYSRETVTINARLTPPKGGVALQLEVSGSRTNLPEVINQLAAKVNAALKVSSTVTEWNAADESAQYFDEAKWALRWGVLSEAQAAADSAWALGKHDLNSAIVRVKSYLLEVSEKVGKTEKSVYYDGEEKHYGKEMLAEHPWGIAYQDKLDRFQTQAGFQEVKSVECVYFTGPPDPKNIDRALHALELYEESSRILPGGEVKTGVSRLDYQNWHNPDWCQLGLDDLVAASCVLQEFNFAPDAQKPVAEKLADLRAVARSVAELIDNDFFGSESGFIDNNFYSLDSTSYYYFLAKKERNILRCKVDWGCFWQDTPEDCLAIYGELMGSPTFENIMDGLVSRPLLSPRLVAWNEADRKRIPNVWEGFIQELSASTNIMMRMAGKAFKFRDADGKEDAAAGWAALLPELERMQAFEKQKQYLANFTPFDFVTFVHVFNMRSYDKAQAAELQPLLAAYKTNLTGNWARIGAMQVGQVEANVNGIINPPATPPPSQPPPKVETPKPVVVAKTIAPIPAVTNAPEIVTNVIAVSKFLPIPLDGLPGDRSHRLDPGKFSAEPGKYYSYDVTIIAHHWFENRLLLDFQYGVINNEQTGLAELPAIAILDPATEHWDVIGCPDVGIGKQSIFYHRSALVHGNVFNCDGGQIKKYDFQKGQWQVLEISDGNNYELFVVNGQLYAANRNMVFEIIDGGKGTRILASTRRQPPVSALDKLDNLGMPALFAGTNHLLQAYVNNTIYLWDQNDWHREAGVTSSVRAEVFEDGVLFRGQWSGKNEYTVPARGINEDNGVSLFQYSTQATSPELCLWQQYHYLNDGHTYLPIPDAVPSSRPLWKMPSGWYFTELTAALGQSNLYLLADHFNNEGQSVAEPYNVKMFCFSHGLSLPQELFLKFDAPDGCPPLTKINPHSPDTWPKMPPAWLLPTANFLFFGLDKPAPPFIDQNIGYGCKPGVWLLPVSKIGPAIATQKQIQLAKQAQAVAAAEQAQKAKEQVQKNLLTKYDQNHNGIMDPDEREAALDDPAFIESELNTIDANHNDRLDVEELAYFDANKNKILEPKEQSGIEIAQHLLAERLLKKFDANGDGVLDRPEFNALVQSSPEANARPMPGLTSQFPDDNHDGKIDLAELETFLKQQMRGGLRSRRMPGAMPFQMRLDANQPVDPRQMFKAAVESYWQNPGGTAGRMPLTP